MRRSYPVFSLILLLNLLPVKVAAQQSFNLPLLSNWDDNTIPAAWTGSYSECWGYAANGKEYAFLASTQGTYFFDVTNAAEPVQVGYFRTKDTTTLVVNKDYATYSHYLYAVSDQGENSLQIFDLQYLPDSVVLVYDSNVLSKRCHTITAENNRLYMCSNTHFDNSFSAMDVYSLADPVNPVLIGTLFHPQVAMVHEVFVRNDTAYCSALNKGLWIYDFSLPATPSLISILDIYPDAGYNHSSWLTDDGKTLAFTDENHGLGVKIYDMTDIHDAQFKSLVRSNMLNIPDSTPADGSVAHIPYIVGNILLISYYHDGVVAYNIADPANPVKVAWYDTHPQNTSYYSYNGCWGLYPFLPSGNIIASDITNGLFMLDGNKLLNSMPELPVMPSLTLGANPVTDELVLNFSQLQETNTTIRLYDITGKLVLNKSLNTRPGQQTLRIPVYNLATGMYIVKVNSGNLILAEKIIKD